LPWFAGGSAFGLMPRADSAEAAAGKETGLRIRHDFLAAILRKWEVILHGLIGQKREGASIGLSMASASLVRGKFVPAPPIG
jgi:hypothetical protein